jgi:hypothetical protein
MTREQRSSAGCPKPRAAHDASPALGESDMQEVVRDDHDEAASLSGTAKPKWHSAPKRRWLIPAV